MQAARLHRVAKGDATQAGRLSYGLRKKKPGFADEAGHWRWPA